MTNKGKSFLITYTKKTSDLYAHYLRGIEKKAGDISDIPRALVQKFTATAGRGKRVRGALMYLGYLICGGKDEEAILEASCAIELFHTAVLIHDDVMDEDDTRRGMPTIHKQYETAGINMKINANPYHYGESMAINAGDLGVYLSWDRLLSSHFPDKYKIACAKIYADYVIRVIYGQILDVTTVRIGKISEDEVLGVYRYKTAEYTGVLPLLMGASLAGCADKDINSALIGYGTHFGWVFQIQDDILGMFGNQKKVGKPVGSDVREGKNTLLMLHLFQHGLEKDRIFLQKSLGNRSLTNADVKKMQTILKSAGSYDYCVKLGWKYVKGGMTYIPRITAHKEYKQILTALLNYMMERVK